MRERAKAFTFALKGLATLWREEPTTRFHAVTSVLTLAAALVLGLARWEWALIVLMIGLVWFAEAVNTAIERLADAVTLEHHPLIGKAKDVASTSVFLASLTAAAIGAVVFVPHLVELFGDAG